MNSIRATMLRWNDIVCLDNAEKQQEIIKIINDHYDHIENQKVLHKAQSYVNYINQKKIDPNPKFKNQYGITYDKDAGKWKSSIKNMVRSN